MTANGTGTIGGWLYRLAAEKHEWAQDLRRIAGAQDRHAADLDRTDRVLAARVRGIAERYRGSARAYDLQSERLWDAIGERETRGEVRGAPA